MPIEKVLIEFARVQLQLIVANEKIVQMQSQIDALTKATQPVPQPDKQ